MEKSTIRKRRGGIRKCEETIIIIIIIIIIIQRGNASFPYIMYLKNAYDKKYD
jgi:hypothetical protein